MRFFHQFGARRTGTNYTQALLEENFKDILVMSKLFWKHDINPSSDEYKKKIFPDYPKITSISYKPIEVEFYNNEYPCGMPPWRLNKHNPQQVHRHLMSATISDNINSIINIKNPYAWISSMARWSCDTQESSQDKKYIFFSNSQEKDENYYSAVIESINSYNTRYSHWLDNASDIISYESLIEDFSGVLKLFETKYNLTRIRSNFCDIQSGCDPSPKNRKDKNVAWSYKKYYSNREYLKNLDTKTIDLINKNINWEPLSTFGYVPI